MRKKLLLFLIPMLLNLSCTAFTYSGLRSYKHPLEVQDMTGQKAQYLLEDLGVPDEVDKCRFVVKNSDGKIVPFVGVSFLYAFSNAEARGTRNFCILKKTIVAEDLFIGTNKSGKGYDFYHETIDYFILGLLYSDKFIPVDQKIGQPL